MLVSQTIINLMIERAASCASFSRNNRSLELYKDGKSWRKVKGTLTEETRIEFESLLDFNSIESLTRLLEITNDNEIWDMFGLLVDNLFQWDETVEGWEFWNVLDDYSYSKKVDPFWQNFNQADHVQWMLTNTFPEGVSKEFS